MLALLKQIVVRKEFLHLCVHSLVWYFGILPGFLIMIVVYGSFLLMLLGLDPVAYWLIDLLRFL